MTRWRKRVGDASVERLLEDTIVIGPEMSVI